jgi:hypothetical protein
MKNPTRFAGQHALLLSLIFSGALAGCGGSQDPILGTGAGLVPAPAPAVVPVVPVIPVVPVGSLPPFVEPTPGPAQSAPISVASTQPGRGANDVCPSAAINASFTIPSLKRLDPATVNATTFTVTPQVPAGVAVTPSSVAVDSSTGKIATFTPALALTPGLTYTASITGGAAGVKDLDTPANAMNATYTWNFTVVPATGACQIGSNAVPLNRAQRYGIFGGTAGMTNSGINTVITGAGGTTADIGTIATATSSITGFHDSAPSDIYTETPLDKGSVTGKILTCTVSTTGPTSAAVNPASCTAATNASLDVRAAYNALAALPPGANPDPGAGNLANLTLAPGVYKAAAGTFRIQGGDLTLNALGDANAVFVFQMASSLTVGGANGNVPQNIILVNGAQAKNVFWQVGSAATINAAGGGTMVGTIIAQSGVKISTAGNVTLSAINGRALSTGASVTMVNTVITVPMP